MSRLRSLVMSSIYSGQTYIALFPVSTANCFLHVGNSGSGEWEGD